MGFGGFLALARRVLEFTYRHKKVVIIIFKCL